MLVILQLALRVSAVTPPPKPSALFFGVCEVGDAISAAFIGLCFGVFEVGNAVSAAFIGLCFGVCEVGDAVSAAFIGLYFLGSC